ncbi:MAG: GAF domain-containing protein [Acidobacteria bacterium]|nr:GAF domain-containing protein [Acidobacteriota bacterium]
MSETGEDWQPDSGSVGLLQAVARTLNCPRDLRQALHAVLRALLGTTGSEASWVMALDEAGGTARLEASIGLPLQLEADAVNGMPGPCRCLATLRQGQPPREPALVMECDRLSELAGAPRHHASVLIRASGRYAGCLNLTTPPGRMFTPEELRLLTAAGDIIGMAFDRERLSETEPERQLHEVARAISGTLELSTVLTSIVRIASHLVRAEGGVIALVTVDGKAIMYPYVFNLPRGLYLRPQPRGKGVAWYCVESGQSLLLADYRNHPSALPRWTEAGVRGFISVPVVAGAECIGALGLFSVDPDRHFSERDLALAESIGRQAGVAIRNARLYGATRRQLDELAALHAVATAATEAVDEESFIERAVEVAGGILQADRFGVLLLDEADRALRLQRPRSASDDRRLPVIPLGSGLPGIVAQDGVPRRWPDTDMDPNAAIEESTQPAEMCVPLRLGERLIGVLRATRPLPEAFTDADERLLTTLAGQLSSAIGRLRAGAALRESEEHFRRLAENAHDVIYRYRLRPSRGFEYVSPACEAISGYTPDELYADPETLLKAIHPQDRATLKWMRDLEPGRPVGMRWIRKDGTTIWLEHRNVPIHDHDGTVIALEGIARDITERKQLEEQLRQSQKMEAIGRLAGGVAHDFNNLLTVILNYSEQQLRSLDEQNPLRRAADEIRKAAERAASLTRQLLTFSRRQVIAPKVVDLTVIVAQMSNMLRRVIGEHIELVTRHGLRPIFVRADPSQIEQVVLNLAINSRDAMPGGGRLTIETGAAGLDAVFSRQHPGVVPGAYVMLLVTDTGHGMDKDTLSRVFEPFFTTKEHGTGLGMSTIYGIVQQSAGTVWVDSEPGRGTRCTIYLPRVDGATATTTEPGPPQSTVVAGSETVLLVEDEASLRSLVREILELDGYFVIEAKDGLDALDVHARYEGRIDLLITDVVMPGMSGRELAERLALLRPRMKVLYTSGYTDDAVLHHGVLAEGTAFLQKPFNREDLARKIRELLGAPKQ